ncbi:MAG: F0F1 ATP synthase subunit delta [Gammaproteobacteria bacterium]|nr:F0F1 ATP synthase subunit delta [Gammaproteobacteria bacterium]
MAELTTIARPYAKAAFQFADESGALKQWSAMLNFAAAVAGDASVSRLLGNPKVTAEQKADGFLKLCADKLDKSGSNFVSLLARNKRLAALPAIAALFEELKSQKEQSVDVEIVSAFALSADQSGKLAASLKKRLGREVNVTTAVDRSILGGAIIKAGDLVIDGSVQGKLARLAESLNS